MSSLTALSLGCALVTLLAAAGCDGSSPPAVMLETRDGRALRWSARDIVLTPAPEQAGSKPPSSLGAALERAAQRWNRALGSCGAPRLLANREVLEAPSIQDDAVNAVVLHERRWCPPGVVEPEECHPAELTGRTHLYPRHESAELAGADIELNAVPGSPGAASAEPAVGLEARLVHELGHVLGLDHPCGPNGPWSRSGQGLKSCAGDAMQRQVMHPSWAARAEMDELTPSAAEVAAVCAAYAPRP